MRVLYVNAGNLYGGIEVLLSTLARERSCCPEMEPHFAVCFEGRFSEEIKALGCPVEVLGRVRVREPWTVWRARQRFGEVLNRCRYDVVVCHGSWSHAIVGPVVQSHSIPLVFWLHDPPSPRRSWLDRWASQVRPDLVICNSRYTAAGAPQLYPGVENCVIYCPVAPRQGRASRSSERLDLRATLNTPGDATVILQVSRLDTHKGHAVHLEALGQLRDVPGWVCWQVASPQRPQEEELLAGLKAQAARLGIADRVRFLGWQPDIGAVFSAADLFCQPNVRPEPFGITFIEALYEGLPVVATTLGGALEIVDSTCGVLVPPQDAGALADALRSMIQNPDLRQSLGRSGPGRAEFLCSPERQIGHLFTMLSGLSARAAA